MGYCGEVSTISALLYYGGYMSQYDMRQNSALKSFHVQTASEYLLGLNDQHCANLIKLEAEEWDRKNGTATVQDYLAWVKTNIRAGNPVTIGVFMNQYKFYNDTSKTAGDSDYDHIVPVM